MIQVSFEGRAAVILSRGHAAASYTTTLDEVRRFFVAEAKHMAQDALRFGGVAIEWWLSSDSEVVARGLGARRNEFNRMWLEEFRKEYRT
jgi:hypothetical protein